MAEPKITEEKLDNLVSECITELCDDNATRGAEALAELATIYARAGMPMQVFQNMRKYIVCEAIERTGDQGFILMKLEQSEKDLNRQRNLTRGHSNIIIH